MTKTLAPCLAALLLMAAPSVAQNISATVFPNPAPQLAPISMTVTDALGQGLTFFNSCVVSEVRAGSPTGTVVFSPFCLLSITNVPAGGTINGGWNGTDNNGAPVPDGTYWMRVRYQVPTLPGNQVDWFPVTITSDLAFPTLSRTAGSFPLIGQTLSLDLDAPGRPGSVYVTAASLTTNVGQGGGLVHLDNDFLFMESLIGTSPLFNNMVGALDAAGSASGMGINLPAVPSIAGLPLHFQAVVQDPMTLGIELTNSVHLTIL